MDYLARQRKLADELRHLRLPALLITHLPNIRYLCGFTGSAGILLFIAGNRSHKITFFTDGRYTQQAGEEVEGAKVVIARNSALVEACEGVKRAKLTALGFEAEHLPYSSFQQIGSMLRGKARLKPAPGIIEQLRAKKDADEVAQIRAAVLMGSSLFATALKSIRPGVTEASVAGELELEARRAGAEKMSFDTIVA